MTQQPYLSAATTVTCPLCGHAQPLDPNHLQDLQPLAGEPAALESITARLTCTGCGSAFLITLQPKPDAQPAPV